MNEYRDEVSDRAILETCDKYNPGADVPISAIRDLIELGVRLGLEAAQVALFTSDTLYSGYNLIAMQTVRGIDPSTVLRKP